MTQYSTVTLLPETVYGTASGNYDGSSQDFYGDVKPAGNYYGGQGNLQTVAYRVSNFTGVITVQATLQTDPLQAAWFDVDEYGDGSTVIPADYHPVNVVGNFAWLRVKVTGFDSGTIQSVTASY